LIHIVNITYINYDIFLFVISYLITIIDFNIIISTEHKVRTLIDGSFYWYAGVECWCFLPFIIVYYCLLLSFINVYYRLFLLLLLDGIEFELDC